MTVSVELPEPSDGVLPSVLGRDLRVVFCGTGIGELSAKTGCYYAHGRNRFWSEALPAVWPELANLEPKDFRRLPEHGIGFADICPRAIGTDRKLRPEDYDLAGLLARLRKQAPGLRVLAFTSKAAARAYLQKRHVDYGPRDDPHQVAKSLFVLPSTSGGNGWWDRHGGEAEWHRLRFYLDSLD